MSDQVERKGGGAPRHDKNSGIIRYSDGQYGVDIFLHKKRHRKKIGTEKQARTYRDDLKAAARRGEVGIAAPRPARRTMGEWLDRYLKFCTNPTDKLHAETWKKSLSRAYPEQFTLDMLKDWAHERLAAGLKIATVHRMMSPLRATYTSICKSGEIPDSQNPFRDMKELKLPKINNERDEYLKLEFWISAAAEMGPWWPYAEFAILSTMRFDNQRRLRWDCIDWESQLADLDITKNGKKQLLPLSSVALQLLRDQLARQEATGKVSEWCWPNSRCGQLAKNNFRNRVWGPAFERAGLKTMGKGRSGLTWHDLRRTGLTLLAQTGEDWQTIQQVGNHGDFRTTLKYLVHGKTKAREAVEKLASLTRMAFEKSSENGGSNAAVTQPQGAGLGVSGKISTSHKIELFLN